MPALSLEAKIAAAVLALVFIVALFAFTVFKISSDAKAHEELAVQKERDIAEARATQIADGWKTELSKAKDQHDKEMADLSSVVFTPSVISVRKYTLSTSSGAATAPPASAGPAASDECVSRLLPAASAELQTSLGETFTLSKRFDALAADYRELYDSWPQQYDPPKSHR